MGGIGYRNLRDHSFGIVLIERLEAEAWPAGVVVEDVSYNPIAVAQWLEAERPFDRVILVSAAQRPGRRPGALEAYRWDGALPDAERIQAAVVEAVTGVIALDNSLLVLGHLRALPPEVVIVEIDPEHEEYGSILSPSVAFALDQAGALVRRLVEDADAVCRLPTASLGGGRLTTVPPA